MTTTISLVLLMMALFQFCHGDRDEKLHCKDNVSVRMSLLNVDVTVLEPAVVSHKGFFNYLSSDRSGRLNRLRDSLAGFDAMSMRMVTVRNPLTRDFGCLQDTTDVNEFAKVKVYHSQDGVEFGGPTKSMFQGASLIPMHLQTSWNLFDKKAVNGGIVVRLVVMFGETYQFLNETAPIEWMGNGLDSCMSVPKQTQVKTYFEQQRVSFAFVTPNEAAANTWKTVFDKDALLYTPGEQQNPDDIDNFVRERILEAGCVALVAFKKKSDEVRALRPTTTTTTAPTTTAPTTTQPTTTQPTTTQPTTTQPTTTQPTTTQPTTTQPTTTQPTKTRSATSERELVISFHLTDSAANLNIPSLPFLLLTAMITMFITFT